jgi:hypothetical protein
MSYSVTIFGCKNYDDVALLFVRHVVPLNLSLFSNSIFFSDSFIPNLGISQVVIDEKVSWSMRVAKSLKLIDDDYILFLLDDYFLNEKINPLELENLSNRCQELSIKYCRLLNTPKFNNFGNMKSLPIEPYSINLQPALWDRKFLITILEKINSNPWLTEIRLHSFFKVQNNFYSQTAGFSLINGYLNAVIKGEWSREVSNIMIENSSRKKMSKLNWFYYRLKSNFSNTLNSSQKLIMKQILKKFGFQFYS